MKRFDYTQRFDCYTDYDANRIGDPIRRITLISPQCGSTDEYQRWGPAYITKYDYSTERITMVEATHLLAEEVRDC